MWTDQLRTKRIPTSKYRYLYKNHFFLIVPDKLEYFKLLLILSYEKLMNSHTYMELKQMFFCICRIFNGFFSVIIPADYLSPTKNFTIPHFSHRPVGDSHKRTPLLQVSFKISVLDFDVVDKCCLLMIDL